jgi:hypothetical protein
VAFGRERSGLRSASSRAHRRKRGMATPAVLPAAHSTGLAASIELIAQLRRDILRYQPIQMVGGEATTTVGRRRGKSENAAEQESRNSAENGASACARR